MAVMSAATDTIEEDVSSEGKNEWQDDSLHYTPIIAIHDDESKVSDQWKLNTDKARAAGCPADTVK